MSTSIHINIGNNITSHLPPMTTSIMNGRRQAISMEQLNNIHNKSMIRDGNNNNNNNSTNQISEHNNITSASNINIRDNVGGSLSSGGSSNTSLDSNDEPEIQKGTGGLTRSASRVSRFRSAKEFFERLSSINNNSTTFNNHNSNSAISIHNYNNANANSNSNLNTNSNYHNNIANSNKPEKPPLPDRPRGNVVNRYNGAVANHSATTAAATAPTATKSSSNSTLNQMISISPTTINNITQRSRPQIILAPYNSNNYNNIQRPTSIDLNSPSLITRSLVSASIEQLLNCSNGSNSSCDSPSQMPRSNSNLLPEEPVIFEGDNVIIGNGSLLIKRNKQLKIKFDENSTLTYEYPSEEAMLAEPESPSSSPVPQQGKYRPSVFVALSFVQ